MIGTQTIVGAGGDPRATQNVGVTNLHVRDVEDKIKLLQPYPTPIDNFFMINEKFTNMVTTGKRSKFEWYEDAFLPNNDTVTSVAAQAAAQTVTVTKGIWRVGDLFLIENTNEVAIVTTVSSTTSIAIAAIDGSTALTSTSNSAVQRLSPAFGENASKASGLSVVAVNKYGYCQILKRALLMTNRQTASKQYGGNDWDYQWVKTLLELREEWERTMLQNGAAADNANTTNALTTTAGFNSLTTNIFNYSGTLTKAFFDSSIKSLFQNGSTFEIDAYCGGDALMDIAAFITNLLQISQDSGALSISSFGLVSSTPKNTKLVDYIHPMGVVHIHYNPQLKGGYSGDIVFVNRTNIKKRFMAPDKKGPRKYRVEMGIEEVGQDAYMAQYLMDQGLQIELEETHGRARKS